MKLFLTSIIIWLVVSSIPVQAASSFFDSSTEGWILVDANGGPAQGDLVWNSQDGNPGGCLEFTDGGNDGGFVSAPTAFLGDWREYEGNLTITYDHAIFSEGSVSNRLPYEIRISGPGGEAQFLGETPEGPSGWHAVHAPLNIAFWNILQGSWTGTLADVTSFRIRIEQTQGHVDVSGIDNVVFPQPTAVVPHEGMPSFRIEAAYPNPFYLSTAVRFAGRQSGPVLLEVFDVHGRRVARRTSTVDAGAVGSVIFDGHNDFGGRLASGRYLARLTNAGTSRCVKLTIIK